MKKRIISAVLGVLLILSVMPCVFAETEQIDFVKLADITAYRFDENGERVELSGADMVKQRFWEMKYVFTTSVADEYDLPIYMEFDFKGITLSPECFEIYVRYAYYNGINKVRLEYMKDGEWEIAKDNINFDWKESGSTMECNNIVVPKNISSDKFRLVLEEIKPSAKTIRVEYISILGKMSEASVGGAVRPEYRRVSVGQDTVLPETVTLLCGDGRTETTAYEIDWPAVDSKKEGTYTVYGTAFGGAVKVKGIVDVYDPEINNNMDHWACDLSVTAKKYGYSQGIQGIDENL
ncbi:MAG: Ig-like domain-containing protein, partial [Monoglobaceae bacterium]